MKISIYLASFVLLKAMMPGALYAPPPNGDEGCADGVKTVIAAPGSSPDADLLKLVEQTVQTVLTQQKNEMTEQFKKQLEQQRHDFESKLATQAEETKKQIAESRKLPPAPPPLPPVQPVPQQTKIKPKPQEKQKTPEEKKAAKAVANSVNEINEFMKQFKSGEGVSGTLRKHKQKGSFKPSVQAVFGSGNSAPGNTQSGSGKTQESGHAQKLSVQDQIKSLQEQQSPQESVKPKIAEKPEGLTARPSVPAADAKGSEPVVGAEEKPLSEEFREVNGVEATEVAPAVEAQVKETESSAEEKPKTLKERKAMLEESKTAANQQTPVSQKPSESFSQLKAKFVN